MEQRLTKWKNLFRSQTIDCSERTDPQVGFKIFFSEASKQLKVKVIGARQLPTAYGSVRPQGYVVKACLKSLAYFNKPNNLKDLHIETCAEIENKGQEINKCSDTKCLRPFPAMLNCYWGKLRVRVFPEREKYETTVVRESWPNFNEEFLFTLHTMSSKNNEDYFKGKFLSLTVYAVLEDQNEPSSTKPRSTLKRFLSFNDYEETLKTAKNRRSYRNSLNSRRTVGAATYNLDPKSFTQTVRDGTVATPDIWRSIKEITSGIQTQSREGKRGAVELTLSYDISEDGKNDTVEVTVTKFRCSLQTMQEHEKPGGQLYIKITAFEYGDLIQKTKSDKFDPTIALKIESNNATLRATVNKDNIEQVKILIRLICKNLIGKKVLLGKIEIDRNSEIWKEIVSTPSTPITKMMNFE